MATTKEAAKANVTAEYVQRGETLDYKNTGTDIIPADTVVTVGGRVGVTGTEIKPGEVGSLHMVGVFRVPKSGEGAVEMGQDLVFDGTGAAPAAVTLAVAESDEGAEDPTPAAIGVLMGYAAAPAQASDKTVLVKLMG